MKFGLRTWLFFLACSFFVQVHAETFAQPVFEGPGHTSANEVMLPVHQILTPAGRQIVLPKLRPQGIAVSPDQSYVVTSGRSAELILIDPVNAAVLTKIPMPARKTTAPPLAADHILAKDPVAQLSFTGLVFSPRGDRLYLSNVAGDIKVFASDPTNRLTPLCSFPLPETQGLARKQEVPAGLAVSADGGRLYAALNLSDRVAEIDAADGRVLRLLAVGVAPYEVALLKDKLYVSCWGGRRPEEGTLTGPAGRGTKVRVDPVRHIASEGSVSVVNLRVWAVKSEILTGLHACGLALSPNGKRLCVANANSDTVTVIDTGRDEIVEQIRLDWQPLGYFGAAPNALCFAPDGRRLYVCNGTQNAVAVVEFAPPGSKLAGLIPVGWYPGAIAFDAKRGALAVANLKGIGSDGQAQREGKKSLNSREHCGSVSLVPVPSRRELEKHTEKALANCKREVMAAAALPPRPGRPPRAVPERAGEPSLITHVIYAIKENRTYDQVLGDMQEGNGAPLLCTFGEGVTPNQHKLARDFVLLDNTHCCGVLSADGHEWSMSGYVTDYLEKQFAGFPRSYPDMNVAEDCDALAYSPSGFIWDAALALGKSVRVFGEATSQAHVRWKDPARKGKPGWLDHIADWEGKLGAIEYRSTPSIASLEGHSCTNTVGWEPGVPDVVRVERFLEELRGWEQNGAMPNLCILSLPMDHTFGTGAGTPTPAAAVADNDLAVGRLIEAVSHTRFWRETAIFIVEDDPQSGWDHVSAYRTTAYVAGPYVRRGVVISELYSQNSLVRTIELILGLPPMNQLDAIATPMTACFQDVPDVTPWKSVPSRISLQQMNSAAASIRDPVLRRDALVSARLPLQKVDACPEDVFNRILWRAMKGSATPYPEWACLSRNSRHADADDF